jgi:flagellar biosynthetic protein FliR
LTVAADPLATWVVSCLLLGLRIAPVFVFAPPFSLTRVPRLFLALFGLAVSICLVLTVPEATLFSDLTVYGIVLAAAREAALGLMFVLVFQLVFGALYLAGRMLDLQAGFGFATLVDPTSQAPVPLVGTLFSVAAGAAFFSLNGHIAFLRMVAASLALIPVGHWSFPGTIEHIAMFASTVSLIALGVAAASCVALFTVDVVVALLSRTVPQMNVLVLSFQVKTLVLLLVLPLSFGLAGNIFLRLATLAIEALPRMI